MHIDKKNKKKNNQTIKKELYRILRPLCDFAVHFAALKDKTT